MVRFIFLLILLELSFTVKANSQYQSLCRLYLSTSVFPVEIKQDIISKIASGKFIPFEGGLYIADKYAAGPEQFWGHVKSPWILADYNSWDVHKVNYKGLKEFVLPKFIHNIENGDILYFIKENKFIKKVKVEWANTGEVKNYTHPVTGELSSSMEQIPKGLSAEELLDVTNNTDSRIKAILLKPSSEFKVPPPWNIIDN